MRPHASPLYFILQLLEHQDKCAFAHVRKSIVCVPPIAWMMWGGLEELLLVIGLLLWMKNYAVRILRYQARDLHTDIGPIQE